MRRIRTTLVILLVALAAPLASAPVVSAANSFQKIFLEYQRTGRIDGCKYTAKELAEAQRQVPNDIEQYAPDFPAALAAAAEQRASGRCRKNQAAPAPTPTPTAPGPSAPTPPPAPGQPTPSPAAPAPAAPAPPTPTPGPDLVPAPAASDNAIPAAARRANDANPDAPFPLLLLAIVGGLLALSALAWAAARWWAWEPVWMVRARHAGAEAGWRTSAAWSEFTDWVRLGR
jgi:hypothetical protein